jgi:hypothetical protein
MFLSNFYLLNFLAAMSHTGDMTPHAGASCDDPARSEAALAAQLRYVPPRSKMSQTPATYPPSQQQQCAGPAEQIKRYDPFYHPSCSKSCSKSVSSLLDPPVPISPPPVSPPPVPPSNIDADYYISAAADISAAVIQMPISPPPVPPSNIVMDYANSGYDECTGIRRSWALQPMPKSEFREHFKLVKLAKCSGFNISKALLVAKSSMHRRYDGPLRLR